MIDEEPDRAKPRTEPLPPRKSPPAAGPHARKDLTNYEATPGTGSLPDEKDDESQDTISS